MATRKLPAVKGSKPPKAAAPEPAPAPVSTPVSAPAPASVKPDPEKDQQAAMPAASGARDEKQAPAAAKRDYIVQDSLHLDGQAFQMGDSITLTDDQVKGLPAGIVLAAEE